MLNDEQIESLLVAALATYSYPLEKAWALRDGLRRAGLCDPGFVNARDAQQVGNALKSAGYDRGGITYIIAPRVISLMEALQGGGLDALASAVETGRKDDFVDRLQTIKGFGPKSAGLAWELMRHPDSQ